MGSAILTTGQPLVTIGLVTWNSASDLPSCLAAIAHQTHANLETIVVDNGSADGSVEVVRRLAAGALIVENHENLGHCRGQNQAIDASHGQYFLPLNPDVTLDPEYIAALVASLETRPEYGSAIGKMWLLDGASDRVLDGTGLFVDRRRHQYLRGHGQVDRGQYDEPGEVFGADGAAPLLRRTMLEDCRLFDQVFDEAFFAYMEDVDLAWRARLFGWKAWYDPAATSVHDRSFRPGMRRKVPADLRRMAVKNRYLTLLKNEGGAAWRRDWWRILSYDLRILGYLLLFEQSSMGSIADLRRQSRQAIRWREKIRPRIRVSREDCLAWFL